MKCKIIPKFLINLTGVREDLFLPDWKLKDRKIAYGFKDLSSKRKQS